MDIDLSEYPWWVQVGTSKATGTVVAGLLHLSVIFKRQLEEMAVISYALAFIVVIFTVLIYSMLFSEDELTVDLEEMMRVKTDYHLVTAFSIVIFAFSIQFMVLPAYTELEKRSNERFATASILSTFLYSAAFLGVGVCGVLLFGEELETPNLLMNLSSRSGAVSVFCRSAFCFVLMFHVPYYFFLVKEYSLVIFDEICSRSMSTKLEAKLADFYKSIDHGSEPSTKKHAEEHPVVNNPDENYTLESLADGADEADKMLPESEAQEAAQREKPQSESGASEHSFSTTRSGLTYKKLPDRVFFWAAIALQTSILIVALSVKSLDVIFDFLGAIGSGCITFLFPGVAYLYALQTWGNSSTRKKWDTIWNQLTAVFFLLCFFIVIGLYFYLQYLKLSGQV
mmetsp:Transcript_12087/g.16406  ORF Transcript_12087/g.16406 Transcript_12087/m.16406 type:complete len:397 (-) Transcript_12087:165-1355(-)